MEFCLLRKHVDLGYIR